MRAREINRAERLAAHTEQEEKDFPAGRSNPPDESHPEDAAEVLPQSRERSNW